MSGSLTADDLNRLQLLESSLDNSATQNAALGVPANPPVLPATAPPPNPYGLSSDDQARLQALEAQHEQAMALKANPNVDWTTGAPAGWRAAVASESGSEGKIKALRALGATDAQPYGSDNIAYDRL